MKQKHGFTLVEIAVVILIVSILAAATTPMLSRAVDNAKWAEGKATAGTIRRAVQSEFLEYPGATHTGTLSDPKLQSLLGFKTGDLAGTYFIPGDYSITAVNSSGIATVTVTGSLPNAPSGRWTLNADGSWTSSTDTSPVQPKPVRPHPIETGPVIPMPIRPLPVQPSPIDRLPMPIMSDVVGRDALQ